MRGLHLCIGAISVALATATANAAVTSVNVNFRQPAGNVNVTGAWSATVSPLAYASQGVAPIAWTNTDRQVSSVPGDVLVLNDSMDVPTNLNYTVSGFTQDQTDTWSGLNLLKSGYWATAPMTLAVGGLATDGTTYDLYIACAEGNAAFPMSLSVAGDPTPQTTTGAQAAFFQAGVNYVLFSNEAPSGGQLVATLTGGVTILSGFQITPHVNAAPPTESWSWNSTAGGDWGTSANWQVANGTDPLPLAHAIVNLNNSGSNNKTVFSDSTTPLNVSQLTINSTATYLVTGNGKLQLDNTGGTGNAKLLVVTGSHRIDIGTLEFVTNTDLTIEPGAHLRIASPEVKVDSGATVTASGNFQILGTLTIAAGGAFNLVSAPAALQLSGLAIAGDGSLGLGSNGLVLHGGASTIESLLPKMTSTAAPNMGLGTLSGAAYIALHGMTFEGVTVVSTDAVVKYTLLGDANLDGLITADDFAQIDAGYLSGATASWIRGDFNHDGLINAADYAAIDAAFAASGGGAAAAALSAAHTAQFGAAYTLAAGAVPEPASLALLGLGAIALLRRRR
ncbi:MAG: PEP-CTERM sorting domain-containing protein [Phycisphaerae bacterium]